MKSDTTYIYGRNSLVEALTHAPNTLERVFLMSRDDQKINDLIRKAKVPMVIMKQGDLPRGIDPEIKHQGFIALVSLDRLMTPYKDFATNLKVNNDTLLVLLGEIQDPQNVGAIIRSAAGLGASGVLIPPYRQSPVTGSVVKVSAGAAFQIPLVSIGNVNDTARDLKDKGFWIYGLDDEAKQPLHQEKFDAPAVMILGNEGKGIRSKTLEACDIVLSIPTNPRCESLNVAASAAVAMYAWSGKHPRALVK